MVVNAELRHATLHRAIAHHRLRALRQIHACEVGQVHALHPLVRALLLAVPLHVFLQVAADELAPMVLQILVLW